MFGVGMACRTMGFTAHVVSAASGGVQHVLRLIPDVEVVGPDTGRVVTTSAMQHLVVG
jgi:hypothetical protein